MTDAGWTVDQLLIEIEKATTEQWSKHQRPLLLSELGMDLTKKQGDYRPAIAPLKLRQFIATQLSNKVVIITHPRQLQKIALIPAGEDFSFEPVGGEKAGPLLREAGERIKASIWAAFVKPLAPNCNRYLDVEDKALRFQDIPNGSNSRSKSARSISSELIVDGQSKEYNPEEVAGRIKTWAAENGLLEEHLYNREASGGLPKNSFFDVFKGLSDSDLRRIEIPFDIVMKLARQ
ncbi:hypothetical protein [Ciceribacter azotifigens]|uniref:hypothetical protein n=1 Tax=Ciceribacter azotifigens TaxID=2069303 RepID=UPI003A87311F